MKMRMQRGWMSLLVLGCWSFQGATLRAEDWPQYRGPSLDGKATEPILSTWPKDGPRRLWKVETRKGFSSFVVGGGLALTLVARDVEGVERESLVAFDAETGKERWALPMGIAKYGLDGGNSGTPDNRGGDGPRSTPAIDGTRAYALSADLVLTCVDLGTGTKHWARDLVKEHGAVNISWKNAASPLVEGGMIYVAAGGAGQALLGLNKEDGRTVWKGQDDGMTHATPTAATLHGTRQVIFFTQKGLVAVRPGSGEVLWRYDFPYRVSTAASPVVGGDIVYCSAGYGVGAGAVRIVKDGERWSATELWRFRGDKPLANHWSTPVYHDGYLYGMFGFKEYGSCPLKCVELATGKEMWVKEGYGPGNVILVGGHLVALGDAGQVVLIPAKPSGYAESARMDALEGKCWSSPSVSGGRLFVRSTAEGACFDLRLKQASTD